MKDFCIISFRASSNSCIHWSTWELHVFLQFILVMVSSSSVQICDTTRISGIHLILPLTIHTAHFTPNNSYTLVLPLIIHTPENWNYFFTSNNSYTQNLNYFLGVWIIRVKTVYHYSQLHHPQYLLLHYSFPVCWFSWLHPRIVFGPLIVISEQASLHLLVWYQLCSDGVQVWS